jgi:DNA polymerase-3 subunit epsilon
VKWLARIISGRPEAQALSAGAADTLRRWQALPEPDLGRAHFETRYAVVNTEATGLNLDTDRLLAVGGLAVDNGLLQPRDAYYATLAPSPADALAGLLGFIGPGPVVVFNAPFNRTMLERAFDEHLGLSPDFLWIDLYFVLPALFPEQLDKPARLADWMSALGIETFQRHHALGDAWAIAQLFLAAQARALAQGSSSARTLGELERAYRQYRRKA